MFSLSDEILKRLLAVAPKSVPIGEAIRAQQSYSMLSNEEQIRQTYGNATRVMRYLAAFERQPPDPLVC